MARIALGLSAIAAAAVIALAWLERNRPLAPPDAPEPIAIDEPAPSPPGSVLSAIASLESESDAISHSSATRFEDAIYGTPLADEGRWASADLQKRWVQRVWEEASKAASRAGETAISAQRLRAAIGQWLDWSEVPGEQIEVRFVDRPPLTISKLRAERYGSIAYSLRAILSVQQDRIVSSEDRSLELAPESIDVLREAIDTVALSALMLADEKAREQNEPEIGEATLQSAWSALLPNLETTTSRTADPGGAADESSRERLRTMLEEMIANKIAAHREYNGLDDPTDTETLLRSDVARYYARTPIPRRKHVWADLLSKFNGHLNEFAMRLLLEASANATAAGHAFIRADDASRAAQRLLPHEIDDFADVKVFPRLAPPDQVTLEAYDCDSFRDFGLHWPPLERTLRVAPADTRLPDPFATEIIAEAISQYGILLLRISGDLARQRTDIVRLQNESFDAGVAVIEDRTVRNREASEVAESPSQIASSADERAAESNGRFFSDVTESSGVSFHHRSANWLHDLRRKRIKTAPTFSGGGVAAEDLDGDGDMDLLFVGGGGNALFLNDGTGRFHDITERAGIDFRAPDGTYKEARNPIIADFDNDGLQDILITYANEDHRLYRNKGNAQFENVSAGSGLAGQGVVSGPATAFDFDGDGLLDLYVGLLGNYLEDVVPQIELDNQDAGANRLFRNLGNMRFEDVTADSGSDNTGWTQAVSHTDFDLDGQQDIIVANDFGRNAFLRNLGGGKFEDRARSLGVTNVFHSMNVGIADLNDDDHPDVYISNMASLVKDGKYILPDVTTPTHLDLRAMEGTLIKESDVLYMSRLDGDRLVAYEPSKDVERGATSTGWAWDAEFFDFDCDGDEDLYLVNGTNDYNAFAQVYNYIDPNGERGQVLLNHGRESNVFFVNEDGQFRNRSAQSGADIAVNSRSTAYLDFDGDGDLDIAVNNFHAPALMFRNNADGRELHWLKIRLIGDPSKGSNRDAIGARIVVTLGDGRRMTREIHGGSGYLSMNPKQQHFGLGPFQSASALIIWPNGERQQIEKLSANHSYTVQQSREFGG